MLLGWFFLIRSLNCVGVSFHILTEATLVMCRIGSVEKECTIEDLQKTGFADHLCTGNTVLFFHWISPCSLI